MQIRETVCGRFLRNTDIYSFPIVLKDPGGPFAHTQTVCDSSSLSRLSRALTHSCAISKVSGYRRGGVKTGWGFKSCGTYVPWHPGNLEIRGWVLSRGPATSESPPPSEKGCLPNDQKSMRFSLFRTWGITMCENLIHAVVW